MIVYFLLLVHYTYADVPNFTSLEIVREFDSNKTAIAGSFNITVNIYNAKSGGNLLYQINKTLSADATGRGFISLDGFILNGSESYFMSIKPNDGNESSREAIGNYPYARFSNRSLIAEDLVASGSVVSNAEVDDDIKLTATSDINTTANLGIGGNITLGQRIIFGFNEFIDNLVDGWIALTGSVNITQSLTVYGQANFTNITVKGNLTVYNINTTGNIDISGFFLGDGSLLRNLQIFNATYLLAYNSTYELAYNATYESTFNSTYNAINANLNNTHARLNLTNPFENITLDSALLLARANTSIMFNGTANSANITMNTSGCLIMQGRNNRLTIC